jgi:Tfp pilus assembly protein PilV
MVSLVIFGVGTIALLSLAPRATQFTTRGQQLTKASQLAQAKVEELRALPGTDASLTDGTHVDSDNPIDGAYQRRWVVSSNSPVQGMSRVQVLVAYPTASADSVAELVTYF